MKITAKNISVDAGMILISGKEFYQKNKSDTTPEPRLYKEFDIAPGKYLVKWNIDDTYNGDICGQQEIEITSATLIVSDPCYWFEDGWDSALDILDSGDHGGILIEETGGDGEWDVEIVLTRID